MDYSKGRDKNIVQSMLCLLPAHPTHPIWAPCCIERMLLLLGYTYRDVLCLFNHTVNCLLFSHINMQLLFHSILENRAVPV